MERDNTIIKTTKLVYPQIYAYTLLDFPIREGWIKIGYTEREDVDVRIREQTNNEIHHFTYNKLWSGPAQFRDPEEWFKDYDFHAYLRKYKNVKQDPKSEWFYYNDHPEQSKIDYEDFCGRVLSQGIAEQDYQLRQEQEQAVLQTLAYAKAHPNGQFLWNAKPRFGKTLSTYDLARRLDADKVLILTHRPSIANSWFDDFERFIAWQTDYAFVSTTETLRDRPVMSRKQFLQQMRRQGKQRMIAFISLQDLKGAISFGGAHNKLSWVKELCWDLLVIDESHEGVDTDNTRFALELLQRQFTLHLSGTPFKAIASGEFPEEAIYNWSYADEQFAKEQWDEKEGNNPYEIMPRLNLFSYQMGEMITERVNQGAQVDGENIDYAFDLNEFFATSNGKFIYEKDVLKWLDSLSLNEKYPFSTDELRKELKHTFWILNRVASAQALANLLKKHEVFKDYEIVLAAGDGRSSESDDAVNQQALERVREAIKNHDKTITLSVGQLTTGVTVPEWTAVLILSNMASPSLYMQAAFRAQNPWQYEQDGESHRKDNAYVFDFSPARTLIIYDEFANNLLSNTKAGGGTSEERRANIRQLLNFFPVIAEDHEGKMVELDASRVMSIPKTIKAQEVVRRGFMSNLLFQNIGGIFAAQEAREILEQLNPVAPGRTVPRGSGHTIDTQGVEIDENGEVEVAPEIIISTTEAQFGPKIYEDALEATVEALSNDNDVFKGITSVIKSELEKGFNVITGNHGLTKQSAQQAVSGAMRRIEREVEVIKRKKEIDHNVALVEYEKRKAEVQQSPELTQALQEQFKSQQEQIEQEYRNQIAQAVTERLPEITQEVTGQLLKESEEKKKNTVEDDVRGRLRGFARTIPSFLMAYGTDKTCLANFDEHIEDGVFQEVTGISLDQFRLLRDKYQFFDQTVFDESVLEFLNKKKALANYFDDSQTEDIFDYIPEQKTNQIFTPKRVVKMMVDHLEEENPGIFSRSDKTFADLYMKSGLYIAEIVKRLYVGLEKEIPDRKERLKHILENQVYGFAPSEIIYRIARNFIFGFDEVAQEINDSHIVHLDTTPYAKGEGDFEAKCKELFGE